MRMIGFELRKLFSEKSFLLIIILLTASVSAYSAYIKPNGFPQECYDKLKADISGKTHSETGETLENRVLEYTVYDTLIWGSINEELFTDKRTAEFSANYKNIEKNSSEITQQLALYKSEYEQFLRLESFPEHINETVKGQSGFSLFNGKNSFVGKNAEKASEAYKKLRNVTPEYAPGVGVRNSLSNAAADCAALILVCLAAVKLFSEERRSGTAMLAVSMQNGAVLFPLAKLAAVSVTAFIGCALFSAAAAVTNEIRFGLFDLSRAIQSVEGYYTSPLDVSVGGFIVINILSKTVCAVCFGFIVSAFSIIFGQTVTFTLSALLASVFGIIYLSVDSSSWLALVKYMNFFAPMDCEAFWGIYLNIDIGGTPFRSCLITLIFISVLLTASVLTVLSVYKRNCIPNKKTIKTHKARFSVNIAVNEASRVLIERKGYIVLFAAVIVTAAYISGIERPLDVDDMMYADYIKNIGGEISENTFEFINAEKARFSKVNAELMQLSDMHSEGKIDDAVFSSEYTALSQKLMGERSLARLEYQLERVKGNPRSELIYDTGYTKMLGIFGKLLPSLIIAISLILLLSPFYSSDNESGMNRLIYSTANGNKRLFALRTGFSAFVGAAVSFAVYLAEFLRFAVLYGTENINSSVKNIAVFSDFPFDLSILSFMILLCALRCIIWAIMSLTALFISRLCPKSTFSITISAIVFSCFIAVVGIC